jgi:transposase
VANEFWLSNQQWAVLEPLIPMNRRGVKPKRNREIISGIVHILKVGCRWRDCPEGLSRLWGIMPLSQGPRLHWRAGQIDAQTRHRAFRCRLRNELAAANRRPVATTAFAAICSCAG